MSTLDRGMAVGAPVAKVASAWAAIGLTSWTEVASALAALYTGLLILDWCWMKLLRPVFEDRGWVKRLRHRRGDETD